MSKIIFLWEKETRIREKKNQKERKQSFFFFYFCLPGQSRGFGFV